MSPFFSRLSYSFGNEDWASDHKALNIQKEDHVFCITASGDRPLNLLSKECGKLTTVDANQIQNHLLRLKMAATEHLEYDEFLSFMGLQKCSYRKLLFIKLSHYLPHDTVVFFRKNIKMIKKGIIYQGMTEKVCKFVSFCLRYLKTGKELKNLFEFDRIEEQRAYLQSSWNDKMWLRSFNFVLSPIFTKYIIKDPGLYSFFGPEITPGTYIYQRFMRVLQHSLAKNNPLVSLILKGKVEKEGFGPCLTQEGMKQIKAQLKKVEIHTDDVVHRLEKAPPSSIDCFSLSDVLSYLKPSDRERLLKAMIRAAKPGARFCLRQFLSSYEIPKYFDQHLIRSKDLEEKLEAEDHSFVYRFIVGTINK